MENRHRRLGFSLIEILVALALIGFLATMVSVALGGARIKARDTKRRADLSQLGRFLTLSCFWPSGGAGEYDLGEVAGELKTKYPQYANMLASLPKDPKTGSEAKTNYYYVVDESGSKCTLYANLENENETVTLEGIDSPTPGRGSGVFEAKDEGWNGTKKFFQSGN